MRNIFRQIKGYTLIETAIVLVIVGMLVGTFATVYTLYSKDKDFRETNEYIADAASALNSYANMFGKYPCPSQPNLGRGQQGHGMELCNPNNNDANPIPAAANCFEYGTASDDLTSGLCVEESTAPVANKFILKGSLPFKTLNIPEGKTLDQYGNKLNYVVTYSMTNKDTFSIEPGFAGAVLLVDNNDNVITEGTDGAHFYIYSSGQNGVGAYTREGVLSRACPGGATQEKENCDTSVANGTYRHAEQTKVEDSTYFDDQGLYQAALKINPWEYPNDTSNDIIHKVPGKLVIGAAPASDLTDASKLEVMGIALSDGGVIQSDKICDPTASHANANPNCFTSEMIGGQLAEGEGLECPRDDIDGVGQYMVGIENGRVICEDEIFVTCQGGTFITGINPDGTIECNDPPAASCDAMELTLCGRQVTMGPRIDGDDAYWRSGTCNEKETPTSVLVPEDCSMYGRRFVCSDGNWIERSTWYNRLPCDCTESFRERPDGACDPGYTGTMSRTDKYYCPQRRWYTYSRGITDNCICDDGAIFDRPGRCPSGLVGNPVARWRMDCTTETFVFDSDIGTACTCPDYPNNVNSIGCEDGFSGVHEVITSWVCPDGIGGSTPGFWDTANNVTINTCACDNSYFDTRTDPCPSGEVGRGIKYKLPWVCDTPDSGHFGPEELMWNRCVPITPPVCFWEATSGGTSNEQAIGKRVGDSCTCNVDIAKTGCYSGSAGSYQFFVGCACK